MAAPSWYNLRDQELYDEGQHYLPQEYYTLNPSSGGGNGDGDEDEEGTGTATNSGILNTDASYDFMSPYTGLASNDYQPKRGMTGNWIDVSETGQGPRNEYKDYVKGSEPDQNILQSGLSFGPISFMLNKMDKFKTLSPFDQEYIRSQMNRSEAPADMYATGTWENKDRYGKNMRSAFGNYSELVADMVKKGQAWQKTKRGKAWIADPNNKGQKLLPYYQYYADKGVEQDALKKQMEEMDAAVVSKASTGIQRHYDILNRRRQHKAYDALNIHNAPGKGIEGGQGDNVIIDTKTIEGGQGDNVPSSSGAQSAQRANWDRGMTFADGGIARLGFQDGGNYKNIFETGAITQTPNNPFRDDGGQTENIVDTTVIQDNTVQDDGGSSWLSDAKNWASTFLKNRNPTILGPATQDAKNQLEQNKLTHANIMGADDPDYDPADSNTWGLKGGGRVGLQAGGPPGGGDPDMHYEAPVEEIDTTTETGDDKVPFVYGFDNVPNLKDFEDKGPGVNFDWNPTELARIQGNIYPTEDEMFNADGTLSGTLGDNFNWESNFNTDQGITDTNLNLNNLYANIDAHKNLNEIGYANNIGDWNYDINYQPNSNNLMAGASKDGLNLGFTHGDDGTDAYIKKTINFANGGLAGLL